MLCHTSAAERNSVYGPITGACIFMSRGSSEGRQPLLMLCCQGEFKCVFIMLGRGLVTNVAHVMQCFFEGDLQATE